MKFHRTKLHTILSTGFAALTLTLAVPAPAANPISPKILPTPELSDASVAKMLMPVEFILEQHIDPPTRQEMVLGGLKQVLMQYGSLGRGLSEEISNLGSQEELREFVGEKLAELPRSRLVEDAASGMATPIDELFLQGVISRVPGGVELIGGEEARIQDQLAANRYVGVGIALTMLNGVPQINKLFYDGPGYRAGVKADDLIIKIDGEATDSKSLARIVQELRGAEGTDVRLHLQQPSEDEVRDITVTRGVTFIPTVEGVSEISPGQWQYLLPDTNIALLRVKTIGPSTVHELKKIAGQLAAQELDGIVMDLRTGGDRLHDIVLVADQLLEDGIIGKVQTAEREEVHRAGPGSLFKDTPIMVLIDQTSPSGRIYLAAALQDLGRAEVVGRPTRLKAYVRSSVSLPNGQRMILPTGYMKRGNGTLLVPPSPRAMPAIIQAMSIGQTKHALGFVQPDHLVSDASGNGDAWIRRAVAELNKKSSSS